MNRIVCLSIKNQSDFYVIGMFYKLTVCGLQFCSDGHPEFTDTARYLNVISNFWKFLSVKEPYKDTQPMLYQLSICCMSCWLIFPKRILVL